MDNWVDTPVQWPGKKQAGSNKDQGRIKTRLLPILDAVGLKQQLQVGDSISNYLRPPCKHPPNLNTLVCMPRKRNVGSQTRKQKLSLSCIVLCEARRALSFCFNPTHSSYCEDIRLYPRSLGECVGHLKQSRRKQFLVQHNYTLML